MMNPLLNLDVRERRQFALAWFMVGVFCVWLDFWTGPWVGIPVALMIPIVGASWVNGLRAGLVYAVLLSGVRFGFAMILWKDPEPVLYTVINTLVMLTVFTVIAWFAHRAAEYGRSLEREVKQLEGLLPICVFCKKIRDDRDEWQPIEGYIAQRSEADFTHGICPSCADQHYGIPPEQYRRMEQSKD